MPDTAQLDPSLIAAKADTIPVIDLAPFLRGTPAARTATAQRIGAACRDIGFFYITNHGVPDALIAETFAQAKRFFALPPAQKSEIAIEKSACHRGWFTIGGENLDPEKQATGDLKEGIKIGRDLPASHPLVAAGTPLHGPNQWPQNLPGWRETMQTYYDTLTSLGTQILHAFAIALDLPETFFDEHLTTPMTTLGPLHYPPQTGPITPAQLGAGAHTDYGCLTLLAQDSVGGLQVKSKNGTWIEAPPIENTFVVNIGDMMERFTNGVFTSTQHRVINTSGAERYSLPFFFDPNFNTPIAPGITAGQHLLDKINASFTYHQSKSPPLSKQD
jgi:isopenicillin N synthase-like dioxygenase